MRAVAASASASRVVASPVVEAAEAADAIGPRVAIPMHYGAGVVGTPADAERFRALYEGEVVIPG